MSILKWLFQNGQPFPMPKKADKIMGEQSERVQSKFEQLTAILNESQAQCFQAYWEEMNKLCDMERQSCYENGFLFATMIWMETLSRLRGETD